MIVFGQVYSLAFYPGVDNKGIDETTNTLFEYQIEDHGVNINTGYREFYPDNRRCFYVSQHLFKRNGKIIFHANEPEICLQF